MASSDRNRLSILFAFFILLLVFAVFYHPTNALSRPADSTSTTTIPVRR